MLHQSQPVASKLAKTSSKLIAGFAAFAATAIIATSGFAAAQTTGKPSKEMCKKAGYTNYGQCVKDWAHHKNHPGNGYGGGGHNSVSVTNNIDVSVNGSNNVINFVTNVFVTIFN